MSTFKKNNRLRTGILLFLVPVSVLLVISIFILEKFSQTTCNLNSGIQLLSCSDLLEKYYPRDSFIDLLDGLPPEKAVSYSDISRLNFDEIIRDQVIFVPPADAPGVNGVSCLGKPFVVDNLSPAAKRFVAIHEIIHGLGDLNETRVNYLATRIEPLGLVQTVTHSLAYSLHSVNRSNYQCLLGRLWLTFKVYFLGKSFPSQI